MRRVVWILLLGLLLAGGGAARADEVVALRLTTTEELHYRWDRGMYAARKTARVVVTPTSDGGGLLRYLVRFRDEHDDAATQRAARLSPADMERLRARVAAARLPDLDGQLLGHLMETHPRFELALERGDGLIRVRGAGFGDHAATVGALHDELLALVRRGEPRAAPTPAPTGALRLTLTRHTATVRRGEGEDAPTYRLTKRTNVSLTRGGRLRILVDFEDTEGDGARTERTVTLSAGERAELRARLGAARLSRLAGVETSNLLTGDTPIYELALARPRATPAVVRGEGYGRHEDVLKPLVDLLTYLARRGPDLEAPSAAEAASTGRGLSSALDRLGRR